MENILNALIFRLKLFRSRVEVPIRFITNILLFVLSLAVLAMMIVHIGYELDTETLHFFHAFYRVSLIILSLVGLFNFLLNNPNIKILPTVTRIDFFYHVFTAIFVVIYYLIGEKNIDQTLVGHFFVRIKLTQIFLFLLALSQISGAILRFLNSRFQPARLFAISFLLLILVGSWLLSLPNCLQRPISYMDALFTATSSVCITGLTVVNIADTFTDTGRIIMLILIQIGGLGVLTFTTLFGVLAMGKTSFRADVLIKDMLNQNNFNDIFKLMRLIFLTTFVLEGIGAVWLYQAVADPVNFPIQRAVFHSVSAFCNAGFSTLPDGLMAPFLIHNNNFLFAISILVILGSIGFPIVNNVRYGLTILFRNIFSRVDSRPVKHQANLFSLNTRIAVWMTILLLSSSTLLFFLTEYNGILADLPWNGKLTTAFFMAMTPRSGGFNCYPMGGLTQIAVILTMILMWIGGGPLSTGGGVKTTTFGLSVMSIWNIMRGRRYVEMYHRRIAPVSIFRASALVFISVVLTAFSVLLITWFDPQLPFRNVVFEVLSGISTCGLSMDTTPLLSDPSKLVIIAMMFCGRVGLLIILESLVPNDNDHDYQYPTDYVAVG